MRSIIIDDEPANRENLAALLQRYCPDISIVAEAGEVESGLAVIRKHRPELLFLDIQLHDASGFDLLRQLDSSTFDIIFVTAYDRYGIQAIKFSALDYLLKPIDIEELQMAVEKARVRITQRHSNDGLDHLVRHLKSGSERPEVIALPLHDEIRYVPVADIVRCEASNTYTHIYLGTGEKILVSQILKEFDLLLQSYGFLRTHQSHLVNIRFVKSWLKEDGGLLLLHNGAKVPVSKSKRDAVKLALSSRR